MTAGFYTLELTRVLVTAVGQRKSTRRWADGETKKKERNETSTRGGEEEEVGRRSEGAEVGDGGMKSGGAR